MDVGRDSVSAFEVDVVVMGVVVTNAVTGTVWTVFVVGDVIDDGMLLSMFLEVKE